MGRNPVIVIAIFIALAIVTAGMALFSMKYAVVAMIGLVGFAVIFYKPFYGLVFYLVLLYLRPQDFVPILEKMRIMLVLAVVIILVFLIHKLVRREHISLLSTRQHILMIALLLIVPLSDIVNGRFAESWDGLNEFLTVFLLFFMMVNLVDNSDRFRKICWILVALTVLISINGIVMHFRGTGFAGTTPVEGTRVRWIGIFGDPNDYALAINSFLPFVLMTLFGERMGRAKKLALVLAGIIMIVTLYYTNSRGGFIAFLLIMGVFAVRRWGLLRGVGVGAAFLVAAVALAPSRMGNISPYETSAAGRVNAWIDGLVFLKAHPILGIGYQNFEEYGTLSAHSSFIECMSELGMLGYFTWMALLYTCYTDVRRVEASSRGIIGTYAQMLQLSLIGFIASAVFLSQAYMPVLYILAALCTLTVLLSARGGTQKFLSAREFLRICLLITLSIVGYKILAIVYI